MRAFSVVAPINATSLKALLNNPPIRGTGEIGLQAPASNIATIFFGDGSIQPMELEAKGAALLKVKTLNSTYIKGNGTDKLSVILFDV